MRLHAGRPGVELEILQPFDLGGVRYFLGLANDDHAPPGLIDGIGAVDLKRRGPPCSAPRALRAQIRAENDGLRLIIERIVHRTDSGWRDAQANAPNTAAGGGEHSHAPIPADLEEIDPSVVGGRAHISIVHRPTFGFVFHEQSPRRPVLGAV